MKLGGGLVVKNVRGSSFLAWVTRYGGGSPGLEMHDKPDWGAQVVFCDNMGHPR